MKLKDIDMKCHIQFSSKDLILGSHSPVFEPHMCYRKYQFFLSYLEPISNLRMDQCDFSSFSGKQKYYQHK